MKKRNLVFLMVLLVLTAVCLVLSFVPLGNREMGSIPTPSDVALIRHNEQPDTSDYSYDELYIEPDSPVQPQEHWRRIPPWSGEASEWLGVGGWEYTNIITKEGVHIVMGTIYDFPSTLSDPRQRSFSWPFAKQVPWVTIEITLPNGTKYSTVKFYSAEEYSNVIDSFHVQIGQGQEINQIQALDDDVQHIFVEGHYNRGWWIFGSPEISFEANVEAKSPPIRIGTGYNIYGESGKDYQGHLVSVSNGRVTDGVLKIGDKTYNLEDALVYIDRGWGNVSLLEVVNHWYWIAGSVGDYTFMLTDTVGSRKLDFYHDKTVFVAKGFEVVANNPGDLTFKFYQPETANPNLGDKPTSLYIVGTFHDSLGRLNVIKTEPYETLVEDTLYSQLLQIPILNKILDTQDFGGHYGRYVLKVTYTIYAGSEAVGEPIYQATSTETTAEILMPGSLSDVLAAEEMNRESRN